MMEERGFVRRNLDEVYVHVLISKNEVMMLFLAHGDAAARVRRGSLRGES